MTVLDNSYVFPLNADLAPDFYAPDGQYRTYSSWWIEGIKDGPITIEMEVVVNGGTPIFRTLDIEPAESCKSLVLWEI